MEVDCCCVTATEATVLVAVVVSIEPVGSTALEDREDDEEDD